MPFVPCGRALLSASISAIRLVLSCSGSNDARPIVHWTMPPLSVRYWTWPARAFLTARASDLDDGIERVGGAPPEDGADPRQQFFTGDKVGHYHGAYPSTTKTAGCEMTEWVQALDRRRKEGQTEAEFNAQVSKDYECDYHGDLEDFLSRKWAKELGEIMAFIAETLDTLHGELTRRKLNG